MDRGRIDGVAPLGRGHRDALLGQQFTKASSTIFGGIASARDDWVSNGSLSLTDVSPRPSAQLGAYDASTYAEWFACLAEPIRVRLLHAVAVAGREVTVGALTEQLGISQSTCSHHLRKLADVGFVHLRKEGTSTLVSVNPACCTGLPHAADAVMGMLGPRPRYPQDLPADVTVRALEPSDWPDVRRTYAEGIATGDATFETEVPDRRILDRAWAPDHRWVAEIEGRVVGWAAVKQVSERSAYSGVAEPSIYVRRLSRTRCWQSLDPPSGHCR